MPSGKLKDAYLELDRCAQMLLEKARSKEWEEIAPLELELKKNLALIEQLAAQHPLPHDEQAQLEPLIRRTAQTIEEILGCALADKQEIGSILDQIGNTRKIQSAYRSF